MPQILNKESEQFIINALRHRGVESIADIMDLEFKDVDEDHDFDREEIMSQTAEMRGSVRLSQGLFYTVKEYNDMRKQLLKRKMKH